jgi:hypothetical protein
MGFSILVEVLNLRVRQRPVAPVVLREPYTAELVPVPVAMESGVRSTGRKPAKRKTGKKRK